MSGEELAVRLALACVVGFCASLQVSYYLTLKRASLFWLQAAAGAVLAFSYPLIQGTPPRIAFTIASIAGCCALCSACYKEKRYHKLYSTVIQAVTSIAILYVSEHLATALGLEGTRRLVALLVFATALNIVWCTLMFVARRHVFTVLPEPESNYEKTFYASCAILAALLALQFGGERFLLDALPSELVFAGLVSMIVVLSVTGVLWQCQQSNSQMIEEDRLALIASQNQIMKRYVDDYVDYSNSVRIIEHDQRHLIDTLSTLLEMDDVGQAKRILDELSRRNADLRCKVFCSDSTVNAILVDAFNRCEAAGVGFAADVRLPEPIAIEDIDLIALLKNVLDNAIECCEKLRDPSRGRIETTVYTASGFLIVSCRNTVDAAPVIRNNKIDTTKSADGLTHGIGIESIHLAAKSYGGQVSLSSNGETFAVKAVLENRPPDDRVSR